MNVSISRIVADLDANNVEAVCHHARHG